MSTLTTTPAERTSLRAVLGETPDRSPAPRNRHVGRWIVTFVVVVAGLAGITAAGAYGFQYFVGGTAETKVRTHRVTRGDLLITVADDGNVESARNTEIRCQVAGGSTILSIVPDGSLVKAGDELVRLDSATIEEQINQQKIVYEKAQATRIQAEKEFESAKIAVQEYLEGTFPQELQLVDAQITVAMENLRSAENILQHTERMARKGYVTMLQRDAQAFAVEKARLDLEGAETQKMVLERFTRAKILGDLETARDTAEARMRSEQAAFELEMGRLTRLEEQLANCVIYAPTDGMVVYANERSSRSGSSTVTIEEGASVRDRQTIIRLPDLSEMQVKVTVHESKVDQLRQGMRAEINIQGRRLQGTIVSIANQPEPGSWFSSSVKEYGTLVRIDGSPEGVRPGMTAEVVILVKHLRDVLAVPVQSLVEQAGAHYVWVMRGDSVVKQPVVVGGTNHVLIELTDGVSEGDQVVLNPRSTVAEARQQSLRVQQSDDVSQRFGAAAEKAVAQPEAATPRSAGTGSNSEGRSNGGNLLQQFDANGDGRLSREEAPERIQAIFDKLDLNSDGHLDADELRKARGSAPQPATNTTEAGGQ